MTEAALQAVRTEAEHYAKLDHVLVLLEEIYRLKSELRQIPHQFPSSTTPRKEED